MSFKDILVHVDNSVPSPARLDVAVALAARHGAHLTGLGVRIVPQVPGFILSQLGSEVADAQRRHADHALDAARTLFETTVRQASIAAEWRDAEADATETFRLHARYADLVIVGQADPRDDAPLGLEGLTDTLLLEAGRPLLVIPYAGTFPTIGQTVMIAWNGSREATRAVHDALPFLQAAKRVEVSVVNPHLGTSDDGDLPGADLCLHLARHGVRATAHPLHAEDMDVGAMILSRVAEEGADLLVMGAWGHSRLRQLILGGVTSHLLRHMTVPVLMSH